MNWRKFMLCAGVAGAVLITCAAAHAALLYNPVVTVVGDGTNTGTGVGVMTSVYLYNASVANQGGPVASAFYNNGLTGDRLINSFTAASEGSLTNNPSVSNNAALGLPYSGTAYVYSAGYNAANNTGAANPNQIFSNNINAERSLGRMTVTSTSVSGPTVLQKQAQATAYNNNNIRGAVGDDSSTALYTAGTASTGNLGGWRNFNANTILSASPNNVRTVELLGGKLFGTTNSGSNVGIFLIDPTGASAATAFITTGTSTNNSPYEFALFKDPSNSNQTQGYNVAYIADDGSAKKANGGVEKWVYNGSTWSQAYILRDATLGSSVFYSGLAGELDAATGKVTLFASTTDGLQLQQITDNGSAGSSTYTTLASFTAGNNLVFRGVALAPVPVPEPSSVTFVGLGSVGGLIALRRKM